MSLTIKTNIASLIAQGSLTNSTNKLNQAIERMTTGLKINHASDNAANYSISTNMTTKINAYQVSEDNVSMGLDLVQTASSTLESMGDLTTRLRALATQAQNGTYGNQSINALTKEANSIVAEINRLQTTAEYNGIKLFEATSSDSSTQETTSKFIAPITRRDTSSMTKLSSVDENTSLTSGTYSISTAEELAKLATMTNNGKIGNKTEFVLANDIDLSVYSTGEGWTPIGTSSNKFQATFDGNGYKISNLYINRPTSDYQGLFGYCSGGKFLNIAIANVNVTGNREVAGLVGLGSYCQMTNSYVTGNVAGNSNNVGCLAGYFNSSTITKSYAIGNATGSKGYVGGLVGFGSSIIIDSYAAVNTSGNTGVGGLVGWGYQATIKNSYATGNVTGNGEQVGGLIGYGNGVKEITNSYATGTVSGRGLCVGGLVGDGTSIRVVDNAYFTDTTGQANGIAWNVTPESGAATKVTTTELEELIDQGVLPNYTKDVVPTQIGINLILQVGVNANESSQIGLTIQGIDLSALDNLDLQSDTIFETLDDILAKINEQQTNLGAVQNRLMSALDEISTQYENLVSSRSTLRDADIADVSSDYIKMQILQNASATLLATANQSPALALQLL